MLNLSRAFGKTTLLSEKYWYSAAGTYGISTIHHQYISQKGNVAFKWVLIFPDFYFTY